MKPDEGKLNQMKVEKMKNYRRRTPQRGQPQPKGIEPRISRIPRIGN
jgi:hypothetical protein